jgi:hypothetical protein
MYEKEVIIGELSDRDLFLAGSHLSASHIGKAMIAGSRSVWAIKSFAHLVSAKRCKVSYVAVGLRLMLTGSAKEGFWKLLLNTIWTAHSCWGTGRFPYSLSRRV